VERDADIRREGRGLPPRSLAVGPVKRGGRIGVRAKREALALELDLALVPLAQPLQADRRGIAPGSQIIRESQNRQDIGHGALF
jgi:hypothetical protein